MFGQKIPTGTKVAWALVPGDQVCVQGRKLVVLDVLPRAKGDVRVSLTKKVHKLFGHDEMVATFA